MLSKLAYKSDYSSLWNHCNVLHMTDLKKIILTEFITWSSQLNIKTVKDYTVFLQSVEVVD